MNLADFRYLIGKARQGDKNALGRLINQFRPYLWNLAKNQLDSAVAVRADPSDVVQQTCLEIHRDFHTFRGNEERELLAWFRQILHNNAANTIRDHVQAKKRSADKDRSMDDEAGRARPLRDQLAAEQSTPSADLIRLENRDGIRRILEELPPDQRQAIELRHLEGRSLQELASYFGRSEEAVAGLLKRGMQKLRARLDRLEGEQ